MRASTAIWLKAARAYNSLSPIRFLSRQLIRSINPVDSSAAICVDVGAGTAPYQRQIERSLRIDTYVAYDVSPGDRTSVVGDASRMPFRDGCAHYVVSFDAIQHFRQAEEVLDELVRILAPGGYLIMTYAFLYPECDFHDFHRWTVEGMESSLKSRHLTVVRSERRGGALFALACGLNWIIQHSLPGQRQSWRSARDSRAVFRAAIVALLTVPPTLIAWGALALDSILPKGGLYMGGAIIAHKRPSAFR